MMKSKLLIGMSALMAAFSLSSCLSDNDSSSYPEYERMVTVGMSGTRLYSDNGEILLPLNTVTGLDKVERAIVAFDVLPAELNGSELESGKTYEVELDADYCYSIPTSKIIDMHDNPVAADSLVNTQDPVLSVERPYVKNGYLTAALVYNARQYAPCYIDLAYDSEKDIDETTNTITFTLYLDRKNLAGNVQINYPYSFRLPVDAYYRFHDASTINVVLRYMASDSQYREVTCQMSKEDFFLSSY